MAFTRTLGPGGQLADLLRQFPDFTRPLLEVHDVLLRADSPFSIAERELIAAYTSGLNECSYCYRAHSSAARDWGLGQDLMDALMHDPEGADIAPRLQPVLRYVRKLTATPTRVTQADADAVLEAGWDETALFHAAAICALFNFMNRLVEGHGIRAHNTTARPPGAYRVGYGELIRSLPRAGEET